MPIDSTIRALIKSKGHITVDEMMLQVLSANSSSYYQHQKLLGSEGDFTTSPEISQLFGEIIGLWCIDQWEKIGKPKKISLVELGPGRGILMRDLLRTLKLVPEFFNALNIELVEINPHFIEWQKIHLEKFERNIKWLRDISNISKEPSIIIANEFFDAMPIKQYIKVKDLWYEIIVILDPFDGKIKFDKISVSKELEKQFAIDHVNARDGAVLEESLLSIEIMQFIVKHIKKYTGSAIVIDYGYDISLKSRTSANYNSTLQAIRQHQYHPLLETLGEADLSAHVDFSVLKNTIFHNGIMNCQTQTQREFLIAYGILLRSSLLQKASPLYASIIELQCKRLISPEKMGNLFRVISCYHLK